MSLEILFKQRFGTDPLIVQAPGRINLMGGHTDYNEGFVLPAAINRYVKIAVAKNYSSMVRIYSVQYAEFIEVDLKTFRRQQGHWSVYVLGVIDQLFGNGYELLGFDMVLSGDIPIGAGLSSSAALGCAIAYALNLLFRFKIPAYGITCIAQGAEISYAEINCGIMDQFACVYGRQHEAIKLDCRSRDYEYIPLELGEYSLVLYDTGVKHSLASLEFTTRREECMKGLELVALHYQVKSLRDVTIEMLNECVLGIDETIYKRCRYVIEENQRVLHGASDLITGDLKAFGEKMLLSHRGLSRMYGVSCAELDFLVDRVKTFPTVLGARMMGVGFGGCTINLVKTSVIPTLTRLLTCEYKKATGRELVSYVVETANGVEGISWPVKKKETNI